MSRKFPFCVVLFFPQTLAYWRDSTRFLKLAGERRVPWRTARLGRNLKSGIFRAEPHSLAVPLRECPRQSGSLRTPCPKFGLQTVELLIQRDQWAGMMDGQWWPVWPTCGRPSLTLPETLSSVRVGKMAAHQCSASREGYLEFSLSDFKEEKEV